MAVTWRVRIAAQMIRGALHPVRPQSHRQAWLSAAAVPLAVLIVGVGLKLIFHSWPQFDVRSAIGSASYIALVGSRQSLALRRRRHALASLNHSTHQRHRVGRYVH